MPDDIKINRTEPGLPGNPDYVLTPAEQAEFHDILARGGMDKENRDLLLADIQRTGQLRKFGYGSLISNPDSETDMSYGGKVRGWEKGAFCKDRYFRGTPDNLGVTMGALPTDDPEKSLPGVVLVIEADGASDKSFGARVLSSVRDFIKRETSLNPIYSYKLVDVETANRGTVKAIICAADPANPLYLGRDGEQLTMEEKAAIIATSKGVPGASPRNTGMAYWRDHVYACELGGFEPDENIRQLIQLAEAYRAQLEFDNPTLFHELVDMERGKAPAGQRGYDMPAYNVPVVSLTGNPRRVMELREAALFDANLQADPLTPDDIQRIKQLGSELGLTLH